MFCIKVNWTMKERKKEVEEEENHSLQTKPTWEHKALSGTDSILCARRTNFLLPPLFFFFLVCEQLLKGIVYQLAVKSTQVLDLAKKKKSWCS